MLLTVAEFRVVFGTEQRVEGAIFPFRRPIGTLASLTERPTTTTMSAQAGETRTFIKGNATKYVKLNVGGALYNTTIGTLTKHDNMLRAMFSGRMEVLTDSEGAQLNCCNDDDDV